MNSNNNIKINTSPHMYTVAPSVTMDEKTFHQYVLDTKNTLKRTLKFTIGVLIAWPIFALLHGHFDVINFPIITLTIILGGIFYFINRIIIQAQYKIPIQFIPSSVRKSETNLYSQYSLTRNPFMENNPSYPGTPAYHARQMRH